MEKKTILLVEDDDVVRDMIKGALEREYCVLEASKCSEASRRIGSHLDLALIDYNLPDGDGFEVLKKVREAKPQLPVIFMTAYSTENLAIKALRTGVTDYIRKPLSFVYLLGKLSEILKGVPNGGHPDSVQSHEVFVMDCVEAFIDSNFKEDLTLERISQFASMDRFRFCRAFKKSKGMSFVEYLNRRRVHGAASMLRDGNLRVKEIANCVGFRNLGHFIRTFKGVHGVSPTEYRNSLKKSEGTSPL